MPTVMIEDELIEDAMRLSGLSEQEAANEAFKQFLWVMQYHAGKNEDWYVYCNTPVKEAG